MILALGFAILGLVLALSLPGYWCLLALLTVIPSVWLIGGGGEKWVDHEGS